MTQEGTKTVTKVVITLTPGTFSIGIQAAECDPYFVGLPLATEEDSAAPLDQALEYLPAAREAAQGRWEEQAKNPTYERPAPQVQPATPRTTPTRTGRQTPQSGAQRPLL